MSRIAVVLLGLCGVLGAASADERTTPAAPREESTEILQAQLDIRKANQKSAEATLAGARRSLVRQTALRDAGRGTAEEFDRATQDAEVAAAQVEARKAEVREYEVRLKERGRAKKDNAGAGGVAVFNMAAVMRDYHKAKYQVYLLNQKRSDLSVPLGKWRDEILALQKDVSEETDQKVKQKLIAAINSLQQKFQAEEAAINKTLNDEASRIIAMLYDEIKSVVDAEAAANGYAIVLAYPDAVSAEERENPYLKELKLKPPAAQPFFVAKQVDLTAAVLKKLNADYPALDSKGKPVDMNKLPAVPASVVPGQPMLPMVPPIPSKR